MSVSTVVESALSIRITSMVDGMKHHCVTGYIITKAVYSGTNAPLPYVNVGELFDRVSSRMVEGIVL